MGMAGEKQVRSPPLIYYLHCRPSRHSRHSRHFNPGMHASNELPTKDADVYVYVSVYVSVYVYLYLCGGDGRGRQQCGGDGKGGELVFEGEGIYARWCDVT